VDDSWHLVPCLRFFFARSSEVPRLERLAFCFLSTDLLRRCGRELLLVRERLLDFDLRRSVCDLDRRRPEERERRLDLRRSGERVLDRRFDRWRPEERERRLDLRRSGERVLDRRFDRWRPEELERRLDLRRSGERVLDRRFEPPLACRPAWRSGLHDRFTLEGPERLIAVGDMDCERLRRVLFCFLESFWTRLPERVDLSDSGLSDNGRLAGLEFFLAFSSSTALDAGGPGCKLDSSQSETTTSAIMPIEADSDLAIFTGVVNSDGELSEDASLSAGSGDSGTKSRSLTSSLGERSTGLLTAVSCTDSELPSTTFCSSPIFRLACS
jgi:hypothetical protein